MKHSTFAAIECKMNGVTEETNKNEGDMKKNYKSGGIEDTKDVEELLAIKRDKGKITKTNDAQSTQGVIKEIEPIARLWRENGLIEGACAEVKINKRENAKNVENWLEPISHLGQKDQSIQGMLQEATKTHEIVSRGVRNRPKFEISAHFQETDEK